MAANQVFCAICKELVADERVMQGSVTCSKQCANDLKNLRRRRRDLKKCRYCNAPSTPEERANYLRWRVEVLGRPGRGRPKKQKPEPEDSAESLPNAEDLDAVAAEKEAKKETLANDGSA